MNDTNLTDTNNLPSLLLVDDDADFLTALSHTMRKKGFDVTTASDASEGFAKASQNPPEFAVVDLKMPGDSGLVLVRQLTALEAGIKIVVLTGFASIATAIEAIKLGAVHYLTKPVDAEEIIAAFAKTDGNDAVYVTANPLSVNRLEWEHIQRVLAENNGNISATARSLNMHRRTLQRKLSKNPAKK